MRNWKKSRLNDEMLSAAKDRFNLRYPGKEGQIITDSVQLVRAAGLGWALDPILFVAGDPIPDAVKNLPRDRVIPVLAYDCDDSAAQMAEYFIDEGTPYLACPVTETALYMHVSRPVRESLLEIKRKAGELSLPHFESFDFCNIAQIIDITLEIKGAYVEIGVFNGVSGCFALDYMRRKKIKRSCVFMDVFEGFVYEEAQNSADASWKNTHLGGDSMEVVSDRLMAYAGDGLTIDVRKHNIISDPFPDDLDLIAVANLDVDMYDAVHAGLIKLAPRMAPKGVIICEDPGHSGRLIGARVAVNKFLRAPEGKRFMPVVMESGQTILFNLG